MIFTLRARPPQGDSQSPPPAIESSRGPIHLRRPFAMTWSHRWLSGRKGVQHVGKAEIEGEAVGVVYLNDSPYVERALMVSSTSIIKSWQRQGAGLSLYLAALDHAREMERPFLHADWMVEVSLPAAWIWQRIALYRTPLGSPVSRCGPARYRPFALLNAEYDPLPDDAEGADVVWRKVQVEPADWPACPVTPPKTIRPSIAQRAFDAGVGEAPLTIIWSDR